MRRPWFSIFISTACGLGYFPLAPGTWGSLAGLVIVAIPFWRMALYSIAMGAAGIVDIYVGDRPVHVYFLLQLAITLVLAAVGALTAHRAARFWGAKDPQKIVIDEVSGQHLSIFLGCALPIWNAPAYVYESRLRGYFLHDPTLNWKYLLLGFILFRVFDIWKPFPARQAESLPGGWGIMADDWVAALYAALLLWVSRALGL